MTFLDATPDLDTKVALAKTLVTVAEGKARFRTRCAGPTRAARAADDAPAALAPQIFVEVERARLTRLLARIAEERGNPQEAAEIMQEVAVETYGALSKEEKVAFILEQVRLVLERGDYTRAQILSKKVGPRTFVEREKKAGDKPARDTTVAPPAEARRARRVATRRTLRASRRLAQPSPPDAPGARRARRRLRS